MVARRARSRGAKHVGRLDQAVAARLPVTCASFACVARLATLHHHGLDVLLEGAVVTFVKHIAVVCEVMHTVQVHHPCDEHGNHTSHA